MTDLGSQQNRTFPRLQLHALPRIWNENKTPATPPSRTILHLLRKNNRSAGLLCQRERRTSLHTPGERGLDRGNIQNRIGLLRPHNKRHPAGSQFHSGCVLLGRPDSWTMFFLPPSEECQAEELVRGDAASDCELSICEASGDVFEEMVSFYKLLVLVVLIYTTTNHLNNSVL
jgi:hypothetical protein